MAIPRLPLDATEEFDDIDAEGTGQFVKSPGRETRLPPLPVTDSPIRDPEKFPKGTLRQPPVRPPESDTLTEQDAHSAFLAKVEIASQEISTQTRNELEYTGDMAKRGVRLHNPEWWREEAARRMEAIGMNRWALVKRLGREGSAQPVYDVLSGKRHSSVLVEEISEVLGIDPYYPPAYSEAMKVCELIYSAAGGGLSGDKEMKAVVTMLRKHLKLIKSRRPSS